MLVAQGLPELVAIADDTTVWDHEYLYQMLAAQNIEMHNTIGDHKIVVQCPHCFDTLGNEYPPSGVSVVIQHTQLLETSSAAANWT